MPGYVWYRVVGFNMHPVLSGVFRIFNAAKVARDRAIKKGDTDLVEATRINAYSSRRAALLGQLDDVPGKQGCIAANCSSEVPTPK